MKKDVRTLVMSVVALTALGACQTTATAQNSNPAKMDPPGEVMEAPKAAAIALFEYQQGTWHSRWDWYDESGEIVGQTKGFEVFETLQDRTAQRLTSYDATKAVNGHALLTYNPGEEKIIFLNIGTGGDYWIMRQDPLSKKMVSEPHTDADGEVMTVRFSTLRQTADEMDIMMERSVNGGQSWAHVFTQHMARFDEPLN